MGECVAEDRLILTGVDLTGVVNGVSVRLASSRLILAMITGNSSGRLSSSPTQFGQHVLISSAMMQPLM